MADKKYYWLKLQNDFFSHKEIKKLRKIAGGDTYTIIYLKMLLLSLNSNGVLYYDGVEDSFVEEIALDLDEEMENVRITMLFLKKHGLIEEKSDSEISLPATINSIGGETTGAIRVRRHRERQRALPCNGVVTLLKQNVNGEKEIEKEKDKEIEIKTKRETKKKTPSFETTISKYTSNEDLAKALNDFIEMRKAIKSPLTTQRAFELMLEKLTKLSNGVDYKKIKILNNSIMSNWKGIFALKEENEERGQRGQLTGNNGQNVFKDEDLPNQIIL